MLSLRRPSDAEVAEFLSRQAGRAFSYADVGATQSSAPDGYNVDHNRIRLGEGEAAFNRAVASVRRWEMFNTICSRFPVLATRWPGSACPSADRCSGGSRATLCKL